MKHIFALALISVFSISTVFAQHIRSKGTMTNASRKSPHDTVKSKNVTVTYGRPYKKGREIFGGLVPYDQVWRTGADEATQITLKKGCNFAGKHIKAGTYTLFTIPGKSEWTIILNSKLGQWGAFDYDKVKGQDVLTAKVSSSPTNTAAEQFTITLPEGGMKLQWDMTSVFVPIK